MKPSISEEILKKYGLKGVHPIADLFPLLAGDDRDEFRESVNERGVVAPIAVNLRGILLEGRNRLIIADELGVECPKVVVDENDEAGWIIAMNLKRRHLDTGQRGMIADQLATMQVGRQWSENDNSPNLDNNKSSLADAAKKMNVSRSTVATARRVRKKADPEVVEKVKSGEMTLHAANETLKQPEQEIKPSAEIDVQCFARIDKIVRLMRDLFSALDAERSSGVAQELHNAIERISLKTQKKKQARASEFSQQKLNFSASARPPHTDIGSQKPNSENNNGRPETGADLDSQLERWQAFNILCREFPGLDASSLVREAFRDGRETYSRSELIARCSSILEQREKEAK